MSDFCAFVYCEGGEAVLIFVPGLRPLTWKREIPTEWQFYFLSLFFVWLIV